MGENSIRHGLVVRAFKLSEDYVMMESWWNAHGSFPPKTEHLPSTGIVIEAGSKPVCAGFLYRTDSKICVFEFVVSDPLANKQIRDSALTQLIRSAKEWAKNESFSLIYTSVNLAKYINRLKEEGFIQADNNMVHLFYEVKK